MVAPAAEALIERIIRRNLARMIAREAIVTRALLGAYESSWRRIEGELRLLTMQAGQVAASGAAVPQEWLTRQAYWRGLQASIEAEFVRFEGNAARVLAAGQREAVTAARADAIALLEGMGLDGIGGELRPARMERWISAAQPGSPLRDVLGRYGTGVRNTIEAEITEGLGMGRGSSGVIRAIQNTIGPEAMTPRINTLVRTEMHRAYRGAQKEQYGGLEEQGIIVGYRWQASLSRRTCGACLAMHGRVFDVYPTGQHPNCRCTVRPEVDPALLPGGSRPPQSGEDWLRAQPEEVQLLALGTKGRLEAFRAGETLASMVTVRENATWGPSVGLTRPGRGGSLPGSFNGPRPAPAPASVSPAFSSTIEETIARNDAARDRLRTALDEASTIPEFRAIQRQIDMFGEVVPVPPTGTPKQPWKPLMSPAEAEAFAAEGAFPDRQFFHFTAPEAASAIRKGGFRVGESWSAYGKGVYTTSIPNATTGGSGSGTVLQVATRAKNPYVYDVRDEWPDQADLAPQGYDSIVIKRRNQGGDDWLIVFDPKDLSVIDIPPD